MEAKQRILVVDDEPQLTRVLRRSLMAKGYDVRIAGDGDFALQTFRDWPPALVITDLAMPNMSGLELCRRLRAMSQVPIIVLSVRGEEATKVEALDAGADDYITKPFGMDELLARIRATLRRKPVSDSKSQILEVGDFLIDLEAHTANLRIFHPRALPKKSVRRVRGRSMLETRTARPHRTETRYADVESTHAFRISRSVRTGRPRSQQSIVSF